MKICIDPGHGGFDSGAVGPRMLKEKDVTLKFALLLGAGFTKCGHKAIFTWQIDQIPEKTVRENLTNIVRVANSNKCYYLISLHMNATISQWQQALNCSVNPLNPEGNELAEKILEYNVKMTGRANSGVESRRWRRFWSRMPSMWYLCLRTD